MRISAFLATAIACSACRGPGAEAPSEQASARLEPADTSFQHIDNTFVFELPDTGGFLINGQAVPRAEIPEHLEGFFLARRPELRAVMVVDNPKWREDAQWIARAARSAGGYAFDAQLSEWPDPPPMLEP